MNLNLNHFFKFSISGIFFTFLGYLLILTFMFLGINEYLSNFFAYGICLFFSYFIQKKFVFKSNGSIRKYLFFFFVAYCINLIFLKFYLLYFNNYLSQLLSMIMFSGSWFFFLRYFVFNNYVQK